MNVEMKSQGIGPNSKTFTGLLLAARIANNADLAWKTLSKTIPSFGINPTNPIYERIVRFVAEKTYRNDIISQLDYFIKNPPKYDIQSEDEEDYQELENENGIDSGDEGRKRRPRRTYRN